MSATLVGQGPRRRARRPRSCSPGSTWSSPRATSSAWSAPTAPASPRCCACSPGCSRPEQGDGRAQPADRHRRLPAAGAGAAPGRDRARVPRPAHRRRRRPAATWTRPPRRWSTSEPGADDAYAAALERWLALGGADLDERAEQVAADLGLRVEPGPADDRAVRRPGRPGRPRLAAAVPLRRLPARRADQRPRPGRPGPAGGVRRAACAPAPSWSATTASSCPHRHRGRRARPRPAAGQRSTAAATRPTWRSARSPGGTPGRRTRSTPTRGRRSRTGRARSAPGWRRASATPGARRPTTTRSAATFRAEASRRSRPPRPGRPSG